MKKEKGITLIALIITIIVMLILVGVTINVALNGGVFSKAEEATTKTKIAQIQEALTIKKAEVLAEYDGVVEEYDLTIYDLSMPTELKTEYENKLIIGKDGILYYNESVVTSREEQDTFKAMGIQPYIQTPVPGKVPFTNYVENGNNYYIYGDKTSNSYDVIAFSREQTKMTIYYVEDGQINDTIEVTPEFIDKNEALIRFGYTEEMIQEAVGLTFNELSDDIFIFLDDVSGEPIICVFKESYSKLHFVEDWYELDTTYTLPTNAE